MKKIFFLIVVCLGMSTQTTHAQEICDSIARTYTKIQEWNAYPKKDSLMTRIVLSKCKRCEILSVWYKNGTCKNVSIPYPGNWRIYTLTQTTIVFRSHKKITVFDCTTGTFTCPCISQKQAPRFHKDTDT